MSEHMGGLPPRNFGGKRYQRKVTKIHSKIDKLYPRLGFSYYRARKEVLGRQEQWDKVIDFIPKLIGIRKNEQDKHTD